MTQDRPADAHGSPAPELRPAKLKVVIRKLDRIETTDASAGNGA